MLGVDEDEVLAAGQHAVQVVVGVRVQQGRRASTAHPHLARLQELPHPALEARGQLSGNTGVRREDTGVVGCFT